MKQIIPLQDIYYYSCVINNQLNILKMAVYQDGQYRLEKYFILCRKLMACINACRIQRSYSMDIME